jgi:esterase/lipase superfamily enzyme
VDFGSGLTHDAPQNATREVLLFIHGYNTPFEDGIYRTAQLAVEVDFRGLPIYFAWPGGEHWWEYIAAVDQVATAANELATLLRLLVRNGNVTTLHVIAHSLGNRVLAQAIDRLGADSTLGQAKIADLVMVAPDVNKGQFAQVTTAMVRQFHQRTVYVSDTDLALRLSSLFSKETRVGQRTPIGVGSEFEAVDATGARDTIMGHSYFVDTDTIAKDISALVVRGRSAAQRGLTKVLDNGATVWQLPK